jgi:hypothetical protein
VTEESFAEGLRLEPLASLRSLRTALREEERQVSYWRRLVQGRLDLARSALAGDRPSPDKLASSTTLHDRADERRSPGFSEVADGGMDRRLAKLAGLWDTPIPWDDLDQLRQVEVTLVTIEAELSSYRHDLHERIDACTVELVGRYRRDPGQLKSLGPPSRS